MVVGSLAHLKHVLVFLFVKGHLEIVEDDIPTSVVLGRGLERLIASTQAVVKTGQTVSGSQDHACSCRCAKTHN